MGGACSAYGGEEKHVYVLVGKPEGKSRLKGLDVDGRTILKVI
jgi:hypothetical protein